MAANTGQTGPDDGWLGQVQEEMLDPERRIIDPHLFIGYATTIDI